LIFESGGNEEEKDGNVIPINDEDELLLDNFYVRVNPDGSRTKVPKPKVSISSMQEEYVIKKSLQEYEAQ
jgi:hypothetical protein